MGCRPPGRTRHPVKAIGVIGIGVPGAGVVAERKASYAPMSGERAADLEDRAFVEARAERRHVDVAGDHEPECRATGLDRCADRPQGREQGQVVEDGCGLGLERVLAGGGCRRPSIEPPSLLCCSIRRC